MNVRPMSFVESAGRIVLLLILLGVLQFLTLPRAPSPVAVFPLVWDFESSKGFLPGGSSTHESLKNLKVLNRAAVYDVAYPIAHTRTLLSREVHLSGKELELEIAGSFAPVRLPAPELRILNARNEIVFQEAVPLRTFPPNTSGWTPYRFRLPAQISSEESYRLRLSFAPRTEDLDSIAVRGRGVTTEATSWRESFSKSFLGSWISWPIGVLLLMTSAALVLPFATRALEDRKLFFVWLLFFVFTEAVFFQSCLFFNWDEWHVLVRFQERGLPGVIYRHNEHFLPVFFLAYFIESKVMQGNYALMLHLSYAIHALNTLLFLLILEKVLPQTKKYSAMLILLGLGYAVSGLHGETLHWAFELCVLLSIQVFAWSLLIIYGKREDGRLSRRQLFGLFLLSVLSPLLFGNGFVLLPIVGMFAWYREYALLGSSFFASIRRSIPAVLASLAGMVPPVLGYHFYQEGAGHVVQESRLFANIPELLNYIFVGTQVGTLLRGLGLVPNLEMFVSLRLPEFMLTPAVRPEIILADIGAGISVAILFLCGMRKNWSLWVLAQLFLCVCLILPALGRWEHGVQQSLALRYHSMMLFGLLMLLAALGSRYWGKVFRVLLLLWLGVQGTLALRYDYFVLLGRGVRLSIEEAQVGARGDLETFRPDPISPASSMEQLESALRWLGIENLHNEL